MKRITTPLAVALMSLVVGACGGDNFSSDVVPELTIDLNEASITIDQVGPADRTTTIASPIIMRNSGKGELKVTKLEWVARPDRLEAYFDGPNSTSLDDGRCSEDTECAGGGVCLSSGVCRDAGFGELPFEVGNRYDLNFLLRRGDTISCPAPGAEVPELIAEVYCGELRIETNATNDAGVVEDGNATIYFVTAGGSGQMVLQPGLIQFTGATAGVAQSAQFTIENQAPSPLTIERGDFGENAHLFEITPPVFDRVIAGNSTESFTLTYSPSAGAGEPELEFSTNLQFSSSSVTTSPAITIEVTQGVGDAPSIEVDPQQLDFADANSRALVVRNYGGATLSISQLRVTPTEAAAFYRVMYQGEDILANFPSGAERPRVPRMTGEEPSELELIVEYDDSATGSSVGTLEILHNDAVAGNKSFVTLLGASSEVAVGEVFPTIFSLRANGPQVEREVAIYNDGNTELEITGVDIQGLGTTTDVDLFSFEGFEGTVAPGAIHTAKVIYTGESEFRHNVVATLESNHAGQADAMTLAVNAVSIGASTMDLSVSPSFSGEALVGQETLLTLNDAGGVANLANARWYILERPEGSELLTRGFGSSVRFVPDVAGNYRFAVLALDSSNREEQVIFEFTATN
ncbi:hypothetical protein DL240_00655 [Lujinxingia litoralis]|uniref:Choice-of-anchor D domain-containing protein n=1 Tax=Lujinxingia litoralis TaxID=2211119 RepID=A0A328CAG0_9DELT|nr:choice-of-anchor D domain-containing protein [Lujinxingia litoralis]RAL24754.1 hypothetical protein DL240_00655 [Lujinxingia litoralis]